VTPEVKTGIVQLCVTESCNLACVYCFAKNKSKREMTLSLASSIIEHHLKDESPFDLIQFEFAGGEPLLAFGLLKDLVGFAHRNYWSRRYRFGFTTNGTLLEGPVKSWLSENDDVYCSVSLDGTEEAHNLNRSRSYQKAVACVPWLLDRCKRLGVISSTKMTVSPTTINVLAEGVIHLHSLGFEQVNANLPYEDLWSEYDRDILLRTFSKQLDILAEYYAARPQLRPPHLINLPIDRIFVSNGKNTVPRWCGSGRTMVCYDIDGRAYPCHRFLPMAVGGNHFFDGLVSLDPTPRSEVVSLSRCTDCMFVSACPSCLGFNWQVYGAVDARTSFHCPFIFVQLKASAKLQILRASVQLSSEQNEIERKKLAERLDRALRAFDLLSQQKTVSHVEAV
jgi:radical SAM protein with 4Fe4S-binding SPASM domain